MKLEITKGVSIIRDKKWAKCHMLGAVIFSDVENMRIKQQKSLKRSDQEEKYEGVLC